MIKTFQYAFKDLDVKINDLAVVMGYGLELPEPFPVIIETGMLEASELISLKGGYRLFNELSLNRNDGSVTIGSEKFFPGQIVTTQLRKMTSAALFICTAGERISQRSKELMDAGALMEGYVTDVIGSVAVEKAMDRIAEQLKTEVAYRGLFTSNRYSPGYCNWSVEDQHKLFALFPPDFCGVKLSESSLMHPIKSVSGIIGIGKDVELKDYQCFRCNDKNCIYGKIRRERGLKE